MRASMCVCVVVCHRFLNVLGGKAGGEIIGTVLVNGVPMPIVSKHIRTLSLACANCVPVAYLGMLIASAYADCE